MGALYGHAVDTDVPLERLREGPAPRGRLEIRRASGLGPVEGGEPAVVIEGDFAVHREDGGLRMWCRATGTFLLDPAARRITAEPAREPDLDWGHRLACVAVPLLLAERGDLALHGSAVRAGDGAVAFVATSGAGKSTLAWALSVGGHAILAEDGFVVTGDADPVLWPGLTGVRLLDPRGGKRVVVAGDPGPPEPVPLRAIVLLSPRGGERAAVEPVAPADALVALMPNTVHAQHRSLMAAFRGSASVVRAIPVVRGRLPDDLAGAPAHAESLLRLVLDAIRTHDA